MDILYKLFQEHQMMLLSSTTTPLPLPYGPDVQCGRSWKNDTLGKVMIKPNYFNTSYLTESYIAFTLKMESVTKNTTFGLKMMVKSGLEKFILKSLHFF